VCEKAREYQRKFGPSLLRKINAEGVTTSIAVGRRIVITTTWPRRKADLEAYFRKDSTSLAEFRGRLHHMLRSLVCSDAESLALLGLGGEMQVVYKTKDDFVLANPILAACPSPRHRQRLAGASTRTFDPPSRLTAS
jgi:hypothetical protein